MAARPNGHSSVEEPRPLPIPIHAELEQGFAPKAESTPKKEPPATEPDMQIASEGSPSQEKEAEGQVEDAASMETNDNLPVDELDHLKRVWPTLIEQINARSKNVAAVFRDPTQVRPYKVSGKIVTISFRYPIHANRSRSEPARSVIEQALTRTMGYECVLEAITFDQEGQDPGSGGSNSPTNESKGPRPKTPAPHETTRGRAAMNIFGIDKFDEQ
jgi:hypothetical protein